MLKYSYFELAIYRYIHVSLPSCDLLGSKFRIAASDCAVPEKVGPIDYAK